jgi:hypothetical protein
MKYTKAKSHHSTSLFFFVIAATLESSYWVNGHLFVMHKCRFWLILLWSHVKWLLLRIAALNLSASLCADRSPKVSFKIKLLQRWTIKRLKRGSCVAVIRIKFLLSLLSSSSFIHSYDQHMTYSSLSLVVLTCNYEWSTIK